MHMNNHHSHTPLDRVTAGYCPACDREQPLLGVIPASPAHDESLALDCGHAVIFPRADPAVLRVRADGTAVIYRNHEDVRRIQRREGKD